MKPGVNYEGYGFRSVTVTDLETGNRLAHSSSSILQQYSYITGGTVVYGDFKSPTPFSYSFERHIGPNGSISTRDGSLFTYEGGTLTNRMTGAGSIPPWEPARSIAYNRCLEKFYEACRQSVDLSTDIAEMGQTRSMLKNAWKLESFIKNRKVQWASKFLEYKFGWLPLLNSIYGAATQASTYVERRRQKIVVAAKARLDDPSDFMVAGHLVEGAEGLNASRRTALCKMTAFYDPVSDNASIDRWTSLNPLGIAWELVPYSFVVDWFYDVGGWLRLHEEAVLNAPGFVSGHISESYSFIGTRYVRESSYGTDYSNVVALNGFTKAVQFQRSIMSGAPTPRAPTFKVDLSSNQIFTIGALIAQHLGR